MSDINDFVFKWACWLTVCMTVLFSLGLMCGTGTIHEIFIVVGLGFLVAAFAPFSSGG